MFARRIDYIFRFNPPERSTKIFRPQIRIIGTENRNSPNKPPIPMSPTAPAAIDSVRTIASLTRAIVKRYRCNFGRRARKLHQKNRPSATIGPYILPPCPYAGNASPMQRIPNARLVTHAIRARCTRVGLVILI